MKKENKKWLNVIASSITVIIWGVVFSIKSEDKTILTFIAIAITLASLFAIYQDKIKVLSKSKKDEIPEAINKEKIEEIIMKEVENRRNNIKIEKPKDWQKKKSINNNIVYAFKINMVLDDESFIIIINANYPEMIPIVLDEETDNKEVEKAMNSMATNPESEPDTEDKEQYDPYGNVVGRVKKKIYNREKKEEKKGEIV